MAKVKIIKIKIEDKATATLNSELTLLQAEIKAGNIEWKNAKKEPKSVPYGVFGHTGKIIVDKDEDAVIYNLGMDVIFKIQAEERTSGDVSSCKAVHAIKKETVSVTIRSVMAAKRGPVGIQLAKAQRLAQAVRSIEAEIARRENAAKLAVEIAATNKLAAEVAASLCGSVKAA